MRWLGRSGRDTARLELDADLLGLAGRPPSLLNDPSGQPLGCQPLPQDRRCVRVVRHAGRIVNGSGCPRCIVGSLLWGAGWCASGLLESPLAQAVGRALGDGATSRNWATITKLEALAASG